MRAGRLTPLLEDWSLGHTDIHVVYPGSRHLSARVRLFVDALIERFTNLPPWVLGPDGRAFIVDETRREAGDSTAQDLGPYGQRLFDSLGSSPPPAAKR